MAWRGVAILVALGPWVNGCHFTYGSSRYAGTGTYAVPRPGAGSQDAVATEVRLVDCDDGPTIEIGDACRLRGSWDDGWHRGATKEGTLKALTWKMGTVVIASGQSCTLPLSAGPTAMTLSTGVTHVRGARVIEVSLAGVVKGGPDAGRAATFSFTAPPAGPLVPSTCPRSSPQDTTRESTAGGP